MTHSNYNFLDKDSRIEGRERFAIRESIESCVVLVLQVEPSAEKVGVIVVNYRRRVTFSPEDRIAMMAIAYSTAVAIRTARLPERNKQTLAAIRELEGAIADRDLDLDEVLKRILQKAMKITGAPVGWIFWYDPARNELEWRLGENIPERKHPYFQPMGFGIVGRAATTLQPQNVSDVGSDKDYQPTVSGTKSELAVPLTDPRPSGAPGLVGVINLESDQLAAFSFQDSATLEILGVLAVIASQIHDLNRQRRQFGALSAVAAKLQRSHLDLDTILRIILTGVTADEGLGYTRALIFLTDATGANLEGRLAVGPLTGEEAHSTWERLEEERHAISDSGGSLTWLLDDVEAKSREIRNRSRQECELSRRIQKVQFAMTAELRVPHLGLLDGSALAPLVSVLPGNVAYASVPLTSHGVLRGLLVVDRSFQDRAMDGRDLGMLGNFAEVAAMAAETRAFHRQFTEAEAAEYWNNMIAELMHTIGTPLTIIDGQVEHLSERVRDDVLLSTDLPEALNRIRDGIRRASIAMRNVRRFFVRPPATSQVFDLVAAVEEIVRDTGPSTKCPPRLDVSDFDRYASFARGEASWIWDVLAELIRNADEALAGAETKDPQILVRVRRHVENSTSLFIEVENNGPEIPAEDAKRIFEPNFSTKPGDGRGFGLAIVWRRIQSLGGRIDVVPGASGGPLFRISLPSAGSVSQNDQDSNS